MKTEKTKKGLRSILILSILAILLVFPGHGLAYQANTHKWIAEQAILLVQIPELDDSGIKNSIITGAYQADYQFYDGSAWVDDWWGQTAPRDHFWNPDTGEALWSELGTWWTADAKAFEYWEKAKQQYVFGNTLEAYKFLGHVAHLLADMSVPAHVHIDPHVGFPDEDSYESYMEPYFYINWSYPESVKIHQKKSAKTTINTLKFL